MEIKQLMHCECGEESVVDFRKAGQPEEEQRFICPGCGAHLRLVTQDRPISRRTVEILAKCILRRKMIERGGETMEMEES